MRAHTHIHTHAHTHAHVHDVEEKPFGSKQMLADGRDRTSIKLRCLTHLRRWNDIAQLCIPKVQEG